MLSKRASLSASIGLIVAIASCLGPPGPEGFSAPEGGDAPGPVEAGPVEPAEASVPRVPTVSGPGLRLTIDNAKIDAAGVATASVTMTDGAGAPLDRNGVYTTSPVLASFVLSRLAVDGAGGPGQYTAYTTQVHTSIDGKHTEQLADADQGGSFTEVGAGLGTYVYRFGTVVPATYDATKTHAVGVWASREFGGKRYVVNSVFHFVPAGGAAPLKREVVTTQACNQCHNPLAYHEGDTARRETSLCILCHADGMRDPNNGNSLDMRVAIHKIHRGKSLPSVVAGTPYVLHMDKRTDDFSTVWFPGEVQNCRMCHQASQGDRWAQKPSQAVCGSCHDTTAFGAVVPPGMKRHSGGIPADDASCTTCHVASGTFLGVHETHSTALTDPAGPKVALEIVSVTNTAPGQTPVMRFKVTYDGAPHDLLAKPFTSLGITVGGPTSDYAQTQPVQYSIQGTAPTGTLVADAGSYLYTFPAPIPADATGTYAVGMEGSIKPNALPTTKSYSPLNPVYYFAVTDPVAVPRRTVVERAKCNSCHSELAEHGGSRKSPEYCVLCHTPNKVNDQRVSRFEVPTTIASSVNFKVMVHKIHRGEDLVRQPYVLGGYPAPTAATPGGTPIDFGKVRFPGKTNACWSCHAGTSYMLPLPKGLLPTKMTQTLACNDAPQNAVAYCASRSVASETFMAPASSACTACHDSDATAVHAQLMTAPDGSEACETCHGSGKQWDVQVVHALQP